MRILLDMDEVLVDFVGGAARLWRVSMDDLLRYWPAGHWDMVAPLGKALAELPCPRCGSDRKLYCYSDGTPAPDGLPCPRCSVGMTNERFWGHIDSREDFWVNLEPLPWCDEVIDLVQSLTHDWHIISSPSWCVSSYSGKVKWLKNRYGKQFSNFALTPHKHIFAMPGVCLVDDRDSNIKWFFRRPDDGRTTGAEAVVFPRHHNSQHLNKDDPVAYLRGALKSMCRPRDMVCPQCAGRGYMEDRCDLSGGQCGICSGRGVVTTRPR